MRLPVGLVALALFVLGGFSAASGQTTDERALTTWRLLDYVSVDYGEAVADGKVVNQAEYDEMIEFAGQVRNGLSELRATSVQPSLIHQAEALKAAIARKAAVAEVAALAKALANDLLVAYPVPLAPAKAPNLARGKALYLEHCASCHGLTGAADGPAAKGLDPPAIAFTDRARARLRSLFGLYQVIGQGLDGTAMASFGHLSADDRWALAFYIGTHAFLEQDAAKGGRLWTSEPALRQKLPNLQALTQTIPADLGQAIGEKKALAVIAYLRRHPEAVTSSAGENLFLARARLAESLAAYEAGDRRKANSLALSAYLDGFEPVEPALRARDGALVGRVEEAMGTFRATIAKGEPFDVLRSQADRLGALFDAAEQALGPREASDVATFTAAFTILLREGLEALLIVVAMVAFLSKVERPNMLRYVHGGWIAALVAGVLTWAAATYLIAISGASRELTEGFGSLIAAVVLVSVGLWMHGKAQAGAWQRYVREKLSRALSDRSGWFLFLLAFVVVYREVFETILFYVALWSDSNRGALLTGAAAGAATLVVVAWALLAYSQRLPITRFFSLSSILIAVLAVVLAGKGVAALQEAGLLDTVPVAAVPRVEILGIYPTVETLAAQVLIIAIVIAGFRYVGRLSSRRA